MNTFWNKGEKDIIQGLDVLGLRSIDQHIETQLLASITTISIRARYLSLIPWIVGEFFDSHKGETNLDSDVFRQLLMQVFDRLELVLILATNHEKELDSKVLATGIIGAEVHKEITDEFNEKGEIDIIILKDKSTGNNYTNPTYGTYYNPCRGFGLLESSPTAPVKFGPNSNAIYQARKKIIHEDSGILAWLLHGGHLTKEMITEEAKYFSIDNIDSIPEEMQLLQEAFLNPYTSESEEVLESYTKFNDTMVWTLSQLDESKKPQELIYDNYDYCTTKEATDLSEIELNWFEFELRRRVHFSLELLLKALSHTLDELNGATAIQVVNNWIEDIKFSNNIEDGSEHYYALLSDYQNSLEDDIFRKYQTPENPSEQALHAISILEVCKRQSTKLLDRISTVENDYMRKAFQILDELHTSKVYESIVKVTNFCVVEPHLKTTLRKMGQGQQCSLRFFPEGKKLVPTGIDTNAGVSGSRLNNTIRMMSDIGLCDALDNGNFIKNDMSDDVINRLRQTA